MLSTLKFDITSCSVLRKC